MSSADQNEARQIVALRNAGVEDTRIFVDHKSGKDFNRPGWRRMRRTLREGDTLVIQSLDRLGRNYAEMLDEWRYLIRKRKANIRILDMPILDTSNKTKGLVGEVIAELVLQLLAFVAENERRSIRDRQRQGIDAARARGVRFGRPTREMPPQFEECAKRFLEGQVTLKAAAAFCGLPESTFKDKSRAFETRLKKCDC